MPAPWHGSVGPGRPSASSSWPWKEPPASAIPRSARGSKPWVGSWVGPDQARGAGRLCLQFNVPLSQSSSAIVHPAPQHQYSINQSSRQFVNGGVGNDWGIFAVFNNTQGGNSGSPVIDGNTSRAVGVHTHGGCTASGGNNNGTSTFNTALWNALGVSSGGVPATPASLTVLGESCYGFHSINWSSVAGATYYELYRSTSSSFSPQFLEASTSDTFAYVDVSTTTYYRVRACNASGCSGYRAGNRPAHYFNGCL
ncbi:MAG: hypothetical protein HC897_04415 [Thermoanaerobaculia bacterium]|nr:hypothetical protein [Thermoanaerobaculia bacterium]